MEALKENPAAEQANGGTNENDQPQHYNTDRSEIDLQEAHRFLSLLDEEAEEFTFQTFADSPEAKANQGKYAGVLNGTLEAHADELARLNAMGAGVFVTINRTDLKGRKEGNIQAVRSVFADTDGAPLDPINKCVLEPHFIVESSAGNWHTYWLTDDLPLADFEGVQRRIARTFNTDGSVVDLPRVLRLPGFYHRKAEPFMVKIIHENGGLPYSAEKIVNTFPPLAKEGTSRNQKQLEIVSTDEILKALNEAKLIRSKRPDGGFNITCPFEEEHSAGSNESETVYWSAFTGGFKTPSIKCMHSHCADRRLADYVEKLDLSSDLAPLTFDEMLKTAREMTTETPPDQIESLARQTAPLGDIEGEKVLKALRKSTDTNITNLRSLVKKDNREKRKQMVTGGTSKSAKPMLIGLFPDLAFNDETGALKVVATLPNITAMLDHYKIKVSYDVISKKTQMVVPGMKGSPDNAGNSALTRAISLAKLNEIPSEMVPAYVEAIADERQVNPVADWIFSRPWDGVDRLPAMCRTLELAPDYPERLRDTLVTRWLISAVAAALKPIGFKARGVLTMQGPQSIGKTSWLQSLVPDPHLRERLVKTDHLLDPNNKDSVLGAVSHWLVELGELDGSFRKADVSRIKGFITADMDKIRRPYARLEAEYQRRTVFFASVNDAQFLVDETGNTRFWTVAVKRVNFNHKIDMQQLWAQVTVAYQTGEQWWLTPDEEAQVEQINKGHRVASPVRELIVTRLNFEAPQQRWQKMSATDLLIQLGFERPTGVQCREAGAALRDLCGEPVSKPKNVNHWLVPPKTVVGEGFDNEEGYVVDWEALE